MSERLAPRWPLVVLAALAVAPSSRRTGTITGTVDRPGVTAVVAIDRATRQEIPGQGGREDGQFTIPGCRWAHYDSSSTPAAPGWKG